ncbi:MAG TPA: hypothetical protein VGR61_09735 [Candidatus Dormibacteraeota bacterium]|nr:hypothetical protein [Candidatus Dormibacteraeota bacterium]
MDAEPNYPWVVALSTARRRLSQMKAGVIIAGTVAFGAVAALAAAASPSPGAQAPAALPGAPAVDVFGQSTHAGPDNPPPGTGIPGATGGDNLGQGAPNIVTAPS